VIEPSEIEEHVREAIREAGADDARRIWVEARGGTVRLHGAVRSSYSRSVAEAAALEVAGVLEIEDEIEIRP
jgi:osmotically-inducible protein OsmY